MKRGDKNRSGISEDHSEWEKLVVVSRETDAVAILLSNLQLTTIRSCILFMVLDDESDDDDDDDGDGDGDGDGVGKKYG
ncbi:hypothetical protein Pmani_031228 [Petrolisthes manimaculis]|uniref:Uncharacterized protein n=1 Tax=Petrolisthes manimaculis TaxID=1843537 RepID=A0AAE1TS71_9EUCA|nr:hypothetical protein Pmani_031228 [Petrolisthes manimaculis]